ncbi:hypothetical protein V5O48_015145 [Marasmius crinis-equi]|uniref:RING-type domain-containing protein n=1 Tax=Marasmius crinis-equi TaxID=585013 RepID=A0ABR3EVC2_9AGAR
MNPEDRTQSFNTVLECLEKVGVDGRNLYRRAKTDMKDPNDLGWMSKDVCPVCIESQFDVSKGCLLACPDKKKYYCENCVSSLRQTDADDLGRIPCPFCRKRAYFVCTQWIFVNDEDKRKEAKARYKRAHRNQQKSQKRKREAEECKPHKQYKPAPDV